MGMVIWCEYLTRNHAGFRAVRCCTACALLGYLGEGMERHGSRSRDHSLDWIELSYFEKLQQNVYGMCVGKVCVPYMCRKLARVYQIGHVLQRRLKTQVVVVMSRMNRTIQLID